MRKLASLSVALAVLAIVVGTTALRQHRDVVVATTTSLYDSGLLDEISKDISKDLDIKVKLISCGTGLALRRARNGEVDAVMVHAPSKEFELLRDGDAVNRKIIAYNFFVIVGPAADPANITGCNVSEALNRIRQAGKAHLALWVSRGDGSGTEIKEKDLWRQAGFDPDRLRQEEWYIESGSGMANTLRFASEKQAYTLSDTATFLKLSDEGSVSLRPLIEARRPLLNVYSVMAVNPAIHREVDFDSAMSLIAWLTSERGQDAIGTFGKASFGRSLFHPAVEILANPKDSAQNEVAGWIEDYAFLEGSECPPAYRYRSDGLYG